MDDESFESGDMTGTNLILIAKFSDENGINTSGGLGHELLAVLDGMTQSPIVLNNFYRTNIETTSWPPTIYSTIFLQVLTRFL